MDYRFSIDVAKLMDASDSEEENVSGYENHTNDKTESENWIGFHILVD